MWRTSPCPMKAQGYERCDRVPRSFTQRRALQWLRRPLGSFSESRKKSRGMNSGCLGWVKGNLSACHNARLLWRGTCLVRVVWSHTVVGLQRLSATHAYQHGGSGSPVAMQISVASAVLLWRMSKYPPLFLSVCKCCKIWTSENSDTTSKLFSAATSPCWATKWDTNDLELGFLGFSNPQLLSDHSILIGEISSFVAGIAHWFSWDTFEIQTHCCWVKKKHLDFLSDNIQNPPVAFLKSAFLQMSQSTLIYRFLHEVTLNLKSSKSHPILCTEFSVRIKLKRNTDTVSCSLKKEWPVFFYRLGVGAGQS